MDNGELLGTLTNCWGWGNIGKFLGTLTNCLGLGGGGWRGYLIQWTTIPSWEVYM